MEGIRIVIAVVHALDDAVLLAVDAHEAAGQTLGGRGDQGEIQVIFRGGLVHAVAHVLDDLEAEVLRLVALAVVHADERLEGLGQTDEAAGQGAVLEHLADRIVRVELFGIQPDALAHEEGIVAHLLLGLDLEAGEKLVDDEVDLAVEILEEEVDVAVAADRDAGQVDRGEAQVAAAVDDLAGGIVGVADDAGAAAHVGRLGLGVAGLVILRVERCIEEGEIGEHPLGGDPHGQLEQVIVGVARVVVDAFLDLENVDREDRGLAVAQTGLGREHQALHDQSALGGDVGAVVERGEGHLRARAGVHRVEVVHERLHGLIGRAAGLLDRVLAGEAQRLLGGGFVHVFLEMGEDGLVEAVAARKRGGPAGLLLGLRDDRLAHQLAVLLLEVDLDGLGQVIGKGAAEGLGDAGRHRIVKVRNGLAAVLVVLVGLERDAGQRRIGTDVVRLPQEAVAGREAALKQAQQVDLAAGGGQREEIEVVDVDIALTVRPGVLGVEDEHFAELLGALGAVLEHGAHGGVAVDIGVFALDVVFERGFEGQILVDLHQAGVHLAHAGALVAIEDELLGRAGVSALDEHLFDHVLNLLDRRDDLVRAGLKVGRNLPCQRGRHFIIASAVGLRGLKNRICDLIEFKSRAAAVSFDDLPYHSAGVLLPNLSL